MSDDASDILPDSAFQVPSEPSSVDDIIPAHALHEMSPPKRVGWAEENLAGPSEVIGSTIANIPHAAAHGVVDLYRRFTGGNTDAPDPAGVQAIEVPTGAGGKQLLGDIGGMLPKRNNLPNQPDDTAIPEFSETTKNVIDHTLNVANDVGGIAAGAGLARGVFSGGGAPKPTVSDVPKLTVTGAPAFDSSPVEGGLLPSAASDRADVLHRIGIENARNSALTGNAKSAATDFQLSKFDEPVGVAAKAQFDAEKTALKNHATKIVEETGGTLGTDEDTLNARGQSIASPFDKLRQYFEDQKKAAYDVAGQRAKGLPIKDLSTTSNLLKDPDFTETLLAKDQGGLLQSVQRQFKRFQELNPDGMTVENAENFRKWMNQVWTPENSATLGKVKGALDDDVLKGAGEDIYGPARKIVQMEAQTLDNPNGISKLMDFDPKNPLNRTTAYSKIPDTLARLDPEQFHNVIKTLDAMPEQLQPEAQAAKAEIKAHLANKIFDAGSSTQGQWDAPAVSKVIKANSAKLQSAFADQPETLAKIKDLDSAGKILKVDQSYPGAAAQAANAVKRGAMSQTLSKGGALAGGAVGGTTGAIVGGPPGAAIGSTAGAAIGGGIGNKLGTGASERSALKRWNKGVTKLSDLAQKPPP